ncbi:MAG: hypothetical protein LUD74_04115 [Tannerellaceae bacterium]|nr:hypothetical protein [Tannerellaceae bacterium]
MLFLYINDNQPSIFMLRLRLLYPSPGQHPQIRPEHLPGRIKGYDQQEIVTIPRSEHSGIREMNAQVEKELILETLKKYDFNRTRTTEALNISRKTLFNKMKKYNLDSQ